MVTTGILAKEMKINTSHIEHWWKVLKLTPPVISNTPGIATEFNQKNILDLLICQRLMHGFGIKLARIREILEVYHNKGQTDFLSYNHELVLIKAFTGDLVSRSHQIYDRWS